LPHKFYSALSIQGVPEFQIMPDTELEKWMIICNTGKAGYGK